MPDLFFDKKYETIPLKKLRKIEIELLKKQLDYIIKNSSFYKKKYRSEGLTKRIKFQDVFLQLPLTSKKELLEDQAEHSPFGSNLSVNKSAISRVHRTSGTSGTPLFIALTKKDVQTTVNTGGRCFWSSGLRQEDLVVHCLNYCLWTGGYTDHQSLEVTGAGVIPYGTGNSSALIETILKLKANAIHCTPSYLIKLEVLLREEFKMSPIELGLKKGFFGGELGMQNSGYRKEIEKKWGIKAMNANYGLSDALSMFGAECQKRTGLHFHGNGVLLAELIDPTTKENLAIEKGCIGELVLTNLEKEAQPLIRYRTHDIIRIIDHNPCSCGRTGFRFEIIGRSDDMIVVKGVNVFPSAIAEIISEFPEFSYPEFQIRLNAPPPVNELNILIECKAELLANAETLIDKIVHKMKNKLYIYPKIQLVEEGSLPRTEGKTKRVIKLY